MTSNKVSLLAAVIVTAVDRAFKSFGDLSAHHINSGAAFSISLPSFFSTALSIAMLAVLALLWTKYETLTLRIGLAVIIAGGAGNCADRLLGPGVIDSFQLSRLHFNFADIAIILGGAIVISGIIVRKNVLR